MFITMNQDEAMTHFKNLSDSMELRGEKLSFAIVKNIAKIKSAGTNAYKAALPPAEKLRQYDVKRTEILTKYCDKNEDGTPIIDKETNSYTGLDGNKEFLAEIAVLREEFKETLDKKHEAENCEFDVDIHMVHREDLPANISVGERILIDFMIDE